jgi:hypothetical protein
MGIRFYCPNGHKLNVKEFQAGRRGICPYCGVSVQIPLESTRPSSKELRGEAGNEAMGPSGGGPEITLSDVPEAQSQDTDGPEDTPAVPATSEADTPFGAPVQPAESPPGEGDLPAFTAPADQPTAFTAPVETQPPVSHVETTTMPEQPIAEPVQPTPVPPEHTPSVPVEEDPLADALDSVWYVRPPSGGQFGPATADVMRSWLAEGRVGPDSLVWREGWEDWQEAVDVFPSLRTSQDPPPDRITAGGQPASTRPGSAYPPSARRRSNPATNAIVITVLVLAVIVLFVVFLYVLLNPPQSDAATGSVMAPVTIWLCETIRYPLFL